MSAAALLRRLGKVEETVYDETGQRRAGVLCVPAIEYDLTAWERRAMAQQAALSHACREDLPVQQTPEPKRQPAPVSIR